MPSIVFVGVEKNRHKCVIFLVLCLFIQDKSLMTLFIIIVALLNVSSPVKFNAKNKTFSIYFRNNFFSVAITILQL